MGTGPLKRIDPLVRLLLVAIVLASLLPVGERWSGAAQWVSNSAVFLLFLLNGLRLPRAEVIRGMGNFRFLLPLVLWCFGAVALAMRDGEQAGLVEIDRLLATGELDGYHLAHAARADLLRRLGQREQAIVAYRQALALAQQGADRQFLQKRLEELGGH